MKKLFIIISVFCLHFGYAQAQSIEKALVSGLGVNTTEMQASVGEPMVSSSISGTVQLYQGYHHETENSVGLHDHKPIIALYKIYPNPASEIVFVELKLNDNLDDLQVSLHNVQGQLLQKQSISKSTQSVSFSLASFSSGTYIIMVESQGGERQTLGKIQKL